MWLLESDGDVFGGRWLWLRPGKTYLFGRTSIEPGMLVVADKTVSRKHITIRVDEVKEGEGQNRRSRSTVTIEDLKTKIGTFVNGTQIKGTAHVLTEATNTLKLGHFNKLFRLSWHPVVLSFSFTNKELQSDPWARLRGDLEQLDIKYIPDYDVQLTTHVVTKKRNTSKGLQALINGAYIVTDSFLKAISDAAKPGAADPKTGEASLLEQDFEVNWPSAIEHLPARGDEPSHRPAATYAPESRRKEIFDGYTFIFYEKSQYDNLLGPITNGKGKALLREVVPRETQIDDFIRYVKSVAGEKGLGEFEDGSEGKWVVVVRWAPASKYDTFEWYADFVKSVSLRLDHRMIDQREFLDAILACEPGILRRPLEVEVDPTPKVQTTRSTRATRRGRTRAAATEAMDVDEAEVQEIVEVDAEEAVREPSPPRARSPPRPARTRRRFRGFDVDDDDEENAPEQAALPQSQSVFVTQPEAAGLETGTTESRPSTRKRPHSPVPMDIEDTLEDIAPAAAAVKRRRIAAGEDLQKSPPPPPADEEEDAIVPESPPAAARQTKTAAAKPKKKGAIDSQVLDLARQRLEESEAQAREEAERLTRLPEDGIDAAEIRSKIQEGEMKVRQPASAARSREQDIADGRWDPKWNGRQNFKKFRKAHQPAGLPMHRIIVGYELAKNKVYGIGDDYWLDEDHNTQPQNGKSNRSQVEDEEDMTILSGHVAATSSRSTRGAATGRSKAASSRRVLQSDSNDDDDDDLVEISSKVLETNLDSDHHNGEAGVGDEDEDNDNGGSLIELDLPRTKRGKAAQKENIRQSQRQTQTTTQQSSTSAARSQQQTSSTRSLATRSMAAATTSTRAASKRAAAAPPAAAKDRPTKKARANEIADSDSDDDGGKFRFGRR